MKPSNLVYQTVSTLAYPLFKPKLQTIQGIERLPAQGGFMIAANHVDFLDGFYIAAAIGLARNIPVHFLTKTNNYWWTTVTIQIPPGDHARAVDLAVAALRQGQVICNFPEGERNPSAKMLPGKTGTVRMALEAGVPIIPLGIACRPGRNMGQSLLYLMSKNNAVTIRIGRAMNFSDATSLHSPDTIREYTRQLMTAIASLCDKTV
ncbi:MAG: 1-acyl-sn-glycerol-3-phosphate acyltransferase [Candidatus Kerfeldbacteria bacterium]|nr:1-acyl-sn-glycerol-3-phosphate acyltransferase [Candidatus Kerfeldbacteria bacterium]